MRSIFLLGTAREGSTRVQAKMHRAFGDTTLFDIYMRKFEALKNSRLFTGLGMALYPGDRKLMDIAEHYTVPIIERSEKSVTGIHPRNVELHFLKDISADYIMWVNGCLPFLKTDTIEAMARVFINSKPVQSLHAVTLKHQWLWYEDTHAPLNLDPSAERQTTQDYPYLESVQAAHIFSRVVMLLQSRYFEFSVPRYDPYLFLVGDPLECMDIDTEHDFKMARLLYEEEQRCGRL